MTDVLIRCQDAVLASTGHWTVICTRKQAAGLARTLESIKCAAANWAMECELVLVDNGSRDNTAE